MTKTDAWDEQTSPVFRRSSGFTLIELILVMVILGILSVVAVPKFIDLSEQAELSAADAVFAAADAAAAIHFASNRAGAALTAITDGDTLLAAFDGTPKGWSSNGASGITHTGKDGTTYTITVQTGESDSAKAVLVASW